MPYTIQDQYTNLPLTNDRKYKLRHPEQHRKRKTKYRLAHPKQQIEYDKEQRLMLLMLIGDTCIFCGSNKDIQFHEIYNKRHITNHHYYMTHIKDFISCCQSCHQIYHRNKYVANWLIA
jgi:hypothetical protein